MKVQAQEDEGKEGTGGDRGGLGGERLPIQEKSMFYFREMPRLVSDLNVVSLLLSSTCGTSHKPLLFCRPQGEEH